MKEKKDEKIGKNQKFGRNGRVVIKLGWGVLFIWSQTTFSLPYI